MLVTVAHRQSSAHYAPVKEWGLAASSSLQARWMQLLTLALHEADVSREQARASELGGQVGEGDETVADTFNAVLGSFFVESKSVTSDEDEAVVTALPTVICALMDLCDCLAGDSAEISNRFVAMGVGLLLC